MTSEAIKIFTGAGLTGVQMGLNCSIPDRCLMLADCYRCTNMTLGINVTHIMYACTGHVSLQVCKSACYLDM